jgi:hypothetical protein
VIDEALAHPISVRDGKTGNLLLLLPAAMIHGSNEVSRYSQLFARVVVECQRADPSGVGLDEVAFIVEFTVDQRSVFIREFAEALAMSLNENDPEVVEAFIRFYSHANDPIKPQFHSSFLESERKQLEAHMSQA